jgi:hypothetical protein
VVFQSIHTVNIPDDYRRKVNGLALPQILERLRGGGELLASNKPSGSRGNSAEPWVLGFQSVRSDCMPDSVSRRLLSEC